MPFGKFIGQYFVENVIIETVSFKVQLILLSLVHTDVENVRQQSCSINNVSQVCTS